MYIHLCVYVCVYDKDDNVQRKTKKEFKREKITFLHVSYMFFFDEFIFKHIRLRPHPHAYVYFTDLTLAPTYRRFTRVFSIGPKSPRLFLTQLRLTLFCSLYLFRV